jgi:hypothetical protein
MRVGWEGGGGGVSDLVEFVPRGNASVRYRDGMQVPAQQLDRDPSMQPLGQLHRSRQLHESVAKSHGQGSLGLRKVGGFADLAVVLGISAALNCLELAFQI